MKLCPLGFEGGEQFGSFSLRLRSQLCPFGVESGGAVLGETANGVLEGMIAEEIVD